MRVRVWQCKSQYRAERGWLKKEIEQHVRKAHKNYWGGERHLSLVRDLIDWFLKDSVRISPLFSCRPLFSKTKLRLEPLPDCSSIIHIPKLPGDDLCCASSMQSFSLRKSKISPSISSESQCHRPSYSAIWTSSPRRPRHLLASLPISIATFSSLVPCPKTLEYLETPFQPCLPRRFHPSKTWHLALGGPAWPSCLRRHLRLHPQKGRMDHHLRGLLTKGVVTRYPTVAFRNILDMIREWQISTHSNSSSKRLTIPRQKCSQRCRTTLTQSQQYHIPFQSSRFPAARYYEHTRNSYIVRLSSNPGV